MFDDFTNHWFDDEDPFKGQKHDKYVTCRGCGLIWGLYPIEDPETFVCFCGRSADLLHTGPYKTEPCPECSLLHHMPADHELPLSCPCQDPKRQRKQHVSKPDPFRRFIDRELKLY